MKQERIILSFIMVLIGLLVAGAVFYFYQSGKKSQPQVSLISPTPQVQTNKQAIFLNLTSPDNEIVVSNKTLTVSGKTNPQASVIIITKADQQIIKSDIQGNFNTTITLDNDQNLITVVAIISSGENTQVQRTVTYSTSNF